MDNVKDRIVQYANRYKLTNADTGEVLGTFDFDEVTGTVTEAGTEINKKLFDSIAADFTDIINGTQPVGAVGATRLTNEDLNTLQGSAYWGKTYYGVGGNSVTNKPAGTSGFYLDISRGGVGTTVHKFTATTDTTGASISPNIYIRQYHNNEWSSWEQIVTADGNYPTLGAGHLATQIKITVSSSALVGWNKFAEILYDTASTNYSYSAILLVNGVHVSQESTNANISESGKIEIDFYKEVSANPTLIGLSVLSGNINANEICAVLDSANSKISLYSYFNLYQVISYSLMSEEQGLSSKPARLAFVSGYYGATAPTGAIYAVVRNNASYANTASYAATTSYADTAETLTEPFTVGKDTTTATTGYVKFASVSLPGAYRSASARFEVLDKNPVNAQTQMCGVEVVARNINTTNVDVVPRLLYGSSAYLSKIYACIKKGAYPVLVDLYFDITSSNPQETISCIKPLFTFMRVTGSTTFTFITDNEPVTALPTDTTNTQLSTVRVLVTEAADSEKLNGKAASDIFESDGVTAKEATNAQKLGNKAASEYALADDLIAHETNISNPHSVTKEQVGLGSVDNTADADKPVSTAQAAAIAGVQGNVDKIVSGETAVGNAEKLNGKAASDIFESDGVTAKKATSLIPDENGAVNPGGRGDSMVGRSSVALGSSVVAPGMDAIAIGANASANSYAVAIGARVIADEGAISIGEHTHAYGALSVVIGYQGYSYGDYSTALGYGANTDETDTNTMQLGGNLSVLRSKVNLTVTSDKRDKADISEITSALAFLEKLNPVTFVSNDRANYISEEDKQSEKFRKYGMCDYDRIAHAAGTKKGERRRCGLLAQEVIEAMQSVYGTDNYANIVNDNFHDLAEKPSDVENKYTLAYANLVPFLIGAIKELNAKIKELEDRNNV